LLLSLHGAVTPVPTQTDPASAVAARKPLTGRRFLLVTLPPGRFGGLLAKHLRNSGAHVRRVILNGGDLLNWGVKDLLWANVPRPLWRAWLNWRLADCGITDVVVFGDTIAYNAEALAAARDAGLRTWVLENGYNRPDWVTLEPNGVNAHSCMPRDARSYDHVDVSIPTAETPHIGAITPFHVANLTAYFTAVVLAWPIFSRYRYPYAVRLWPQIFGHIRRFWSDAAQAVIADERPFFLACLQREGDSQLVEHSELKTNRAFMTRVIASFAASADPGVRLVFKNHPLDPGIADLHALCRAVASEHGVADRVTFLDGGVFAPLARASQGVVAVNSTAAYAALGFGRPVKLLGRAVFDIEGLTDKRSLDAFWRRPIGPDAALFARFRRRLSVSTQIHGSFHNPRYVDVTARRVVERLIMLEEERSFLWRRTLGRVADGVDATSGQGRVRPPIYRALGRKYDHRA